MPSRRHAATHADTPAAYERASSAWPSIRRDAGEAPWLARFASRLPPGGRVLDLGCGSGEPVGGWLSRAGFAVTGVDAAPGMIAHARAAHPGAAHPGADWRVADMRDLPGLGRFDGVLSWDGSFHLSREEQRIALPRFAARVRPGGAMMLTVGPRDGETTGTVGAETVYHASLSREAYLGLLKPSFARVSHEPFGADPDGRHVLLATGRR